MSASSEWLVVCLFLLNLSIYAANDNPKLEDVLLAVRKLVSYYRENHKEMNLDGIYGLRVLEGQVKVLLDEHVAGRHRHLSSSEVNSLQRIWEEAKNISEMSLPYLKQYDPEYYQNLKPLVDRPMSLTKDYRKIDLDLRWSKSITKRSAKDDIFNEDFSDKCMGQLMGTSRQDGLKCVITADCLEEMLARGKVEYHVTHQLLYTMLAEETGCKPKLEEFLSGQGEAGGLEQIQKDFCSNHYLEVQQQVLSIKGEIIPMYQDLFMEEEFVCPVLGYMEFLHVDWLKQILAWQKPSGCYGRMQKSQFANKYDIQDTDYAYENKPSEPNQNQRVKMKPEELRNIVLGTRRAPLQGRNNNIQNVAPVGMSNNVVVQQGANLQNKLQMRIMNESVQNMNPNAQISNEVNVGAGQALPLHDLDIGANDGLRDQVQQQRQQNGMANMNQQQNLPNQQLNIPQNLNLEGANNPNINNLENQVVQNRMEKNLPLNKMGAQFMGQNNAGGMAAGPAGMGEVPGRVQAGVVPTPHRNIPTQLDKLEPKKWQHPFEQKKSQDYHGDRVILRKLLVEKELDMGCLSHKTAVAAGALSQYLRFMVNPGTEDYQQFVRIDGINYMMQSAGGHEHQFGRNQREHNQVFQAQQNQVGANGVIGQIKPPLDLMKRDADVVNDDKDEGAGDLEDEQQGEEIEIPDQGLEQPNNRIFDENDETIHVDPNEEKNEENDEYDEDDNYDDVNNDDKDGDEDGNYLDNKDNEQDDENYDENEQKRERLAAQNQAHINPKFQRHIDLNIKANGRGNDREYEQYLDEEEMVNNNHADKPKLHGGQNAHGLQIPNVQPRNFDGHEPNDDADQGYNYYVNRDENEEDDEKEKVSDRNIYPKSRKTVTGEAANIPHLSSAQNSNHIGKAYLLLLITMFGLMYLMYRFVKQRRVIIKYHHRGYYR